MKELNRVIELIDREIDNTPYSNDYDYEQGVADGLRMAKEIIEQYKVVVKEEKLDEVINLLVELKSK